MSKLMKLVVASVAGFAAGVLLAPKSGKETRAELAKQAKKAKKQAAKKAELLKDVADDSKDTIIHSADAAGKEAVEFGRSAKATAERIAAEAAELGGEARTRARRVAHEAKAAADAIQKEAKDSLR